MGWWIAATREKTPEGEFWPSCKATHHKQTSREREREREREVEEKGYPDALHQLQHQQQPSNNVRETPTIAGRGFPATQSLSYRWGFLPLSFLSPSWDIDPSHPLCNTVCPSLFFPHPMHLHIFLLETTMYSKFPSILREQGCCGIDTPAPEIITLKSRPSWKQ